MPELHFQQLSVFVIFMQTSTTREMCWLNGGRRKCTWTGRGWRSTGLPTSTSTTTTSGTEQHTSNHSVGPQILHNINIIVHIVYCDVCFVQKLFQLKCHLTSDLKFFPKTAFYVQPPTRPKKLNSMMVVVMVLCTKIVRVMGCFPLSPTFYIFFFFSCFSSYDC